MKRERSWTSKEYNYLQGECKVHKVHKKISHTQEMCRHQSTQNICDVIAITIKNSMHGR